MAAALALTALLVLVPATAAGAHANVSRWWQFDPVVWHEGWHHSKALDAAYTRWQRNHPRAGTYRRSEFSHVLRHRWRMQHFHQALSHQAGLATWYDQTGSIGALPPKATGLAFGVPRLRGKPRRSTPNRSKRIKAKTNHVWTRITGNASF